MKLGIGIISAGKVGAVLGAALRRAGHTITGVYARSEDSRERAAALLPGVEILEVEEIVRRSELVLIAIPDREIAPLVGGLAKLNAWQTGQLVIHTAGSLGADVLAPAAEQGALTLAIHPAMTFTGTSLDLDRLSACPFAVSGPATIIPVAEALVAEMGGVPVRMTDAERPRYHAALAHGSNHLVTLVAQAMRLLEEAGIDEPGEFLRPLLEASLDGALRSGEALITGPVQRGDAQTCARHMSLLEGDIRSCYRALALATTDRAEIRRVIGAGQADELREVLEGEEDSR